MNSDDIFRMAKEADKRADQELCPGEFHPDKADVRDVIFARLVAAAEREACAKVCEEDAFVEQWKGLAEAAQRIRARGEM